MKPDVAEWQRRPQGAEPPGSGWAPPPPTGASWPQHRGHRSLFCVLLPFSMMAVDGGLASGKGEVGWTIWRAKWEPLSWAPGQQALALGLGFGNGASDIWAPPENGKAGCPPSLPRQPSLRGLAAGSPTAWAGSQAAPLHRGARGPTTLPALALLSLFPKVCVVWGVGPRRCSSSGAGGLVSLSSFDRCSKDLGLALITKLTNKTCAKPVGPCIYDLDHDGFWQGEDSRSLWKEAL